MFDQGSLPLRFEVSNPVGLIGTSGASEVKNLHSLFGAPFEGVPNENIIGIERTSVWVASREPVEHAIAMIELKASADDAALMLGQVDFEAILTQILERGLKQAFVGQGDTRSTVGAFEQKVGLFQVIQILGDLDAHSLFHRATNVVAVFGAKTFPRVLASLGMAAQPVVEVLLIGPAHLLEYWDVSGMVEAVPNFGEQTLFFPSLDRASRWRDEGRLVPGLIARKAIPRRPHSERSASEASFPGSWSGPPPAERSFADHRTPR